jgi:hypothetical protein
MFPVTVVFLEVGILLDMVALLETRTFGILAMQEFLMFWDISQEMEDLNQKERKQKEKMSKNAKKLEKIDFSDSGHWVIPENIETFGKEEGDYFGMVYLITLPNGYWYIGCKQFISNKKLKPLKNKTRSRRIITESDWKTYSSSSNTINNYISKNGKEGIEFRVLSLVKGGKFELKYCEIKHQITKNCLFEEKSINGIVNVRLSKKKTFNF